MMKYCTYTSNNKELKYIKVYKWQYNKHFKQTVYWSSDDNYFSSDIPFLINKEPIIPTKTCINALAQLMDQDCYKTKTDQFQP